MSNRTDAIRAYLGSLVRGYNRIDAEHTALLAAAVRIPQIESEKQILIADAQFALNKYNEIEGTNYTLAQVREWFTMNNTGVLNG